MKSLFQPAVIAMIIVAGLTACKKDNTQPANAGGPTEEIQSGGLINPNMGRKLVKKGTDSLVYNRDGKLIRVIYTPSKYVSYQKSGNTVTASTFESNVLRLKVVYTLDNGRVAKSVHTSYESNIGVSKTWLYDYHPVNGRLLQKYNKDNTIERINFTWIGPDDLSSITFYSGTNQHLATVQFTRHPVADMLQLNSPRSSLDPYLKIFGTRCGTLAVNEDVTYPLSPASSFKESHSYIFDREGYPVKVEVRDPENNWNLKYTHHFSYLN